jgi:hypothetical protein
MTTRHSPTTASDLAPSTIPSGSRTTLVASALAVSAAAVASVLLWHPWPVRDRFGYGDIAPVRDGMFTGIVIDALAFAVLGVALSLAVCMLVRSRGAVWAAVGAVLTALGGIAFAMGAFAFASLAWYATDTTAIPVESGTEFLKYAVDNPQHGMVLQMAGFLLFTLGSITLFIALIRARTVPVWLPITFFVLVVAQFTPVPSRVLDFIQVALMALLVVLAWMVHRETSAR